MVQGKLKGVLKCFNDVVDPIIKKYSMPKKLSIAMAEGDDVFMHIIASRSTSCACSNDHDRMN